MANIFVFIGSVKGRRAFYGSSSDIFVPYKRDIQNCMYILYNILRKGKVMLNKSDDCFDVLNKTLILHTFYIKCLLCSF